MAGPVHAGLDTVTIKSVIADLSVFSMTIRGSGFDTVNDTTVTLGEFGALQIQSETSSQIVTDLPHDIVPGNYLLTVTVTKGTSEIDEVMVAIIKSPPTYEIGEAGPAGGIVFYVTDNGLHGLEAAPMGQGSAQWGCFGTKVGADGTAVGTGAQNTVDILLGCPTADIAADLADDYTLNGYDNWFLPSIDELNEMYVNLHLNGLGDFASSSDYYWSSSEYNSYAAFDQVFLFGDQFIVTKEDDTLIVRPVRAF